jgi:hypothetical protein
MWPLLCVEEEVLRPITQSVGVLAAAALMVAGLSAGVASAAPAPTVSTKAGWQADIGHVQQPGTGCYRASYPALAWRAARCVTAPKIPLIPRPRSARHAGPDLVGDGTDYSAQVSGLISQATGTFNNVSSGITAQGYPGGTGSLTANAFSLQLNSQFFAGSPACSGAGVPADCEAWQQFVYTYETSSTSYIFMQYWLIDYDATCPAGWYTYSEDCYTNSNAADVSTLTASQLASLRLTASATSGGNDGVSLAVGSGTATSVTNSDSEVHLASYWTTTEWGVYGDGGGTEAYFGSGASLEAQTALTATSSAAPSCVSEGFTGETNNLTRTSTPALGTESSPTMASAQTDGTAGTASCAVAAAGSGSTGILKAGQELKAGQSLYSPSGQYELIMQTDGNLVVYENGSAIWNTGTEGTGSSNYLIMQTDGNLVVYTSANKAVWNSGTEGTGSSNYLDMQNDGNLVVYTSGGTAEWSSKYGRA